MAYPLKFLSGDENRPGKQRDQKTVLSDRYMLLNRYFSRKARFLNPRRSPNKQRDPLLS